MLGMGCDRPAFMVSTQAHPKSTLPGSLVMGTEELKSSKARRCA